MLQCLISKGIDHMHAYQFFINYVSICVQFNIIQKKHIGSNTKMEEKTQFQNHVLIQSGKYS
jgi:hypothetical protein